MRSPSLIFCTTASASTTSANPWPLSTVPGIWRFTSPFAILTWRRRTAFWIFMAASALSSCIGLTASALSLAALSSSGIAIIRGFARGLPSAAGASSRTGSALRAASVASTEDTASAADALGSAGVTLMKSPGGEGGGEP